MSSFQWPPIGSGGGIAGVSSFNTLTGDVNLIAGSGISLSTVGNNITVTATGGGIGTVTSVAMTVPSFLTVSGSPITGAGTFAISINGGALTAGDILYYDGTGIVSAQLSISGGTLTSLLDFSLPSNRVDAQGISSTYGLQVSGAVTSLDGGDFLTDGSGNVTMLGLVVNGTVHATGNGTFDSNFNIGGVATIGSGTSQQHILNTLLATNASGIGTLTNLPSGNSGNPTGYITMLINGSVRHIPFW